MYINLLSILALATSCQSASILKGKNEELKYKDFSVPGRYGDNTDDSAVPGRYGDFSKKRFLNRELSSDKSGLPGRYGDYSRKSSVPGRYGDTSLRGILKRNNAANTYQGNNADNMFEDNVIYHGYEIINADSLPNLPGRYAGDEQKKRYSNEDTFSLIEKYNDDSNQDTAENKRGVPGRYGDEERHEVKNDVPGRYGDDNGRKDREDNSDLKIVPGRYGDGNTMKDTKKIPGRYGDEKSHHIEKVHKDDRLKNARYVPGRYGDERGYKFNAQKLSGVPGRYGDELYLVGIPGRYGDERKNKYIANKDDENVSNAKKKEKYRYKSMSTKIGNRGLRSVVSLNKRILPSVK